MANLKKHFVFKVGTTNAAGGNANPIAGDLLLPGFSKSAFMNEVSSLLDHCGLYVSSMNEFCSSGCSLAKCLVKVFHAVPLYRETASSLLNNWEEIAQTTAAASASVKTETLMQLQDVLTRLESSGENKEDELAESVHAVSSCLMAYIELQTQFSYSVSKTLSKLSRQHNGFLKTSRAEDAVRKQFSQIINRLTGPSTTKSVSSPTSSTQPSTPQQSHSSSVWPAEMHLAPSGVELTPVLPDAQCSMEAADNGLDDVINLLSIGAIPPITKPTTTSTGPPKVPPRPDAVSQDAFRVKQLEAARGVSLEAEKNETPSWSPFSQWGPEWSTEDLTNWPSRSTHSDDQTWMRWQTAAAKEKTSTWPRPLREPTTPWEFQADDDDETGAFEAAAERRDGEKLAKTCTWPLKIDDNAWMESMSDAWKKNDFSPRSSQPEVPWERESDEGFKLFSQRQSSLR